MVKADKMYKIRVTVIRDKRILFSRENSKLCLGLPEMLRAAQDQLAPAASRSCASSKVGSPYAIKSQTAQCAIIWKQIKKTTPGGQVENQRQTVPYTVTESNSTMMKTLALPPFSFNRE